VSPRTLIVAAGTTVSVGKLPTGIAATNTTGYVANANSNTVSAIGLTLNPPAVVGSPIPVGQFPAALALSQDGSRLYVANFRGNSLTIVSTADNSIAHTVAVGIDPDGVLEVGGSVYVANLLSGTISVVNPGTGTTGPPISLPAGTKGAAAPSGMVAIGSTLYVDDVRNGRTDEVDLTGTNPTVSVTVGTWPAYIALAGSIGYVANPGSNSVSVLDLSNTPPTVTATPTVGTAPYGLAAAPASLGEVFVSNSGSNNLSVIDTTSHAVVGSPVHVGATPDAVAVTPNGTKMLVSNETDNTVSVLSVNQPPTVAVPGAQSVGQNPSSLVFSSASTNAITVGDGDGGSGPVQLTLSVSHGTLTLSGTTGLTFGSGSNGSGSMTLTGSVTDVNAALNGLSYTPSASYSGSDSLTATANDLGNTANIGKPETTTSSVAITVLAAPTIASTPSYSGAVGNTTFGVGTTPSQPSTNTSGNLITDSGATAPGGLTLTVVTSGNPISTAHGGTVTVNSSGTFTYHPPVGYTGPDSFPFTVTDGSGTATGTADITVAGKVWYVNDGLGTNGNGTSTSPFNTLASVNPASGAGDYVFLYGSATTYVGGIVLKSTQTLVGQSAGLVVGAQTLVTAGGSNPEITNSGGAGITLAEGVTVAGVTVSGTSGAGIGGAVNSATIASSVQITNTTGDGFAITGGNGGTVNDAATISENATSGAIDALAVSGRSGGTVNQTGPITGATDLTSNTGATINVSGGITATTGTIPAFVATGGGTVTVTGSSNTLATTSVTALDIENTTIGALGLTFTSISAGTSTAGPLHGILVSGTGTAGGVTVTGDGSTALGGDGSGGTIFATGNAAITDNAAIEIGTPEASLTTAPDPVGTMSFTDMNIAKAGTASEAGVLGENVSTFTLAYTTIANETFGLRLTGYGSSSGQFNILGNKVTGSNFSGLEVFYPELNATPATNGVTGTIGGYINGNTVTGASNGEGIDTWETGTGSLTVDVLSNTVTGVQKSYGILSQNGEGGGSLDLTLTSNIVTMGSSTTSLDAIYVEESTPGSLCVNPTLNTFTATGIGDDFGFDATGFLIGSASPSPLILQGYTGPSDDSGGQVEAFLEAHNTLAGPAAGDQTAAGSDTGGPNDFIDGTCSTSFGNAPA
jgi:YVTN family beta-propeller protein